MNITAYDLKYVMSFDKIAFDGDGSADVWSSELGLGIRAVPDSGALVCQLVQIGPMNGRIPYGCKFTVIPEHIGQLPAYFPRAWSIPQRLLKL